MAWLPYAWFHLVHHLAHLGVLGGTDQVLTVLTLSAMALIPVAILVATRPRRSAVLVGGVPKLAT